jgi:ATP-dependent Clp protease ATP-binding subunit ClpA
MITTSYVQVWIMAKKARRRLGHPVLTSEHLFFACLRLHDQRHWDICRHLPVDVLSVWSHLQETPPSTEPSEDFLGVTLGVSAKTALERAESEAARHGHSMTGTNNLMRALLAESEGPVHSLLAAAKAASAEVAHKAPQS